jgi:uncharacterized protein (DUF885 family)
VSTLGLTILLAASHVPAPDRAAALHALFDEAWEFRLREDPLFATQAGDHRYDALLPSMTPKDLERRAAFHRDALARARAIEPEGLSAADRVSLAMFERQLSDWIADYDFGQYRIPLNADSGFHTDFADLPSAMRFASVTDYESYIARLSAFPRWVAEEIARMRDGVRAGFTVPRVALQGVDEGMRALVVTDPEKSPFYAPFRSFPTSIPEAERGRLVAEGRRAIVAGAVRGYSELAGFVRDEYLPAARETVGASALPRGREYYEHLVRAFTTLDVTPDQVHETGLSEVARIRAEMEDAIRRSGFQGSFADFLQFLRTDPRFYAKTPDELLERASRIAKRMDGKLPSLFGRLPRQPYGVEPVPAHLAPKYTGGRYVEAPIGGTRGGTYWVNTYALPMRPFYTLEALTLHEAVPGHHLQISLQQELTDLPAFRRYASVGAFVEGWALYAERLGLEAGFYEDPYSDFGRLTYEMWRACRLVVDTGLHAKGWTRQQAIDYLAANTALSLHEVTTETDRYISWPGQALCYKMGELKIRELRKRAEAALGERFDRRAFHDAVLAQGAVPLSVLGDQVDAWIETRRAK